MPGTDLSGLTDEQLLAMHQQATAQQAAAPDLSSLSDDDLIRMHAAATAPNPKLQKTDIGGIADAGLRGAASGASFGLADELYGVVGALANPTNSTKDFSGRYHEARDYARGRDAKAHAEHGTAFTTGQVAGSIASAFNPLTAPLNASKGAGLIEMAAKGAAQGALTGAGEAKEFTDIPEEALSGAKTGALVAGGLGAAGKVGGAVLDALRPAKAASVLLNVPEEAVQRYMESPEAVNAARPRSELVHDFLDRVENLRNEVLGGSKASRDILSSEGQKLSGSEVADIFDKKAEEILKRSEGVMDDPEIAAAYKWLRDKAQMYRGVEGEISTNRVKDLVQSTQKGVNYESAPGVISPIDNRIRGDVSADVNSLLKSKSPAYTEQMKGVAKDTQLLSDVADLAKSPQGFDNLLKRTQRGNTPHIMDSLNHFDERTGGGLMSELQNSAVKDALERGGTNGSRNVNLHGGIGEAVGESIGGLPGKLIGKTIGLLGGATVDKYAGPIARSAVDVGSKLNALVQSSDGLQKLGKFAMPLVNAARRGNQSLAVTHYLLSQQNPEYNQLMNGTK